MTGRNNEADFSAGETGDNVIQWTVCQKGRNESGKKGKKKDGK